MPRPTAEFEDVECVKDTGAALLCIIDGKEKWIPKSVVSDDSEVYDADKHSDGTLIVHEWFAIKEGMV